MVEMFERVWARTKVTGATAWCGILSSLKPLSYVSAIIAVSYIGGAYYADVKHREFSFKRDLYIEIIDGFNEGFGTLSECPQTVTKGKIASALMKLSFIENPKINNLILLEQLRFETARVELLEQCISGKNVLSVNEKQFSLRESFKKVSCAMGSDLGVTSIYCNENVPIATAIEIDAKSGKSNITIKRLKNATP